MMIGNPLVSVLMTAYNRENFIAEAIESVLASTYSNFELIILDDGSTDKTVEIAKKFSNTDSRVKVFVNEKNIGQFPNRNKIVQYANGEYLKYFDSDDVMKPNCLSIMVAAMEQYPEAFAGAEHYSESEKLPIMYSPRELYINHFFKGNNLLTMGPSAVIFRRAAFEQLNGFDENIGILSDTLFLLKIAAISPIVGFQPETFFWRRHDEQITVGQDNVVEMAIQRSQINQIVLRSKDSPLNSKEKKIILRNIKNIMVRNLVRFTFNQDFKVAQQIFKGTALSLKDFFLSIFPNKKVNI